MFNVVRILQYFAKAHTNVGIVINREAISIIHIVTDDDGSLKVKTLEEFADSKTHLESTKAMEEALSKQ